MASGKNSGVSFDDLIQADRKKRGQALADQMFGKTGSGVHANRNKVLTGPGASLAARLGVQKATKRSASASGSASPKPSINNQWTHDLHQLNNPRSAGRAGLPRTHSASHIERGNRLYANLQREKAVNVPTSLNISFSNQDNRAAPLNIRGRASGGPYVVILSNFAPGTTAADIEAVVRTPGPSMESCRLISARPTVIAEILFSDLSDAEAVIATFNNQIADGRKLHVYLKVGGPSPIVHKRGPQPVQRVLGISQEEEQYDDLRYTRDEPTSAAIMESDRDAEAMDLDASTGRVNRGSDYRDYERYDLNNGRREPAHYRNNRYTPADNQSWSREGSNYRRSGRGDDYWRRR